MQGPQYPVPVQAPGAKSLSVRLAADPASVPGARRFVVDGLTGWGYKELADVAELVVSELAGNAALHSAARFLYITLRSHDGGVRIEVEDDGSVSPDAVSPTAVATHPAEEWAQEATTGRGLAIVSMLAKEWGVDITRRGKRVWAEVTDPDTVYEVRPPTRAVAPTDAEPALELPPGWVLVRLTGCPIELSIRQDKHLDELVRELQLVAADRDNPASRAIAAEIEGLLISPAHARLAGRRMAEQAQANGLDHADIEMAMPPEFAGLMRRLDLAVKRADQLCEQNQLLAVASPPEVRELRDWMAHEIIVQIEEHATPVSWAEWQREN